MWLITQKIDPTLEGAEVQGMDRGAKGMRPNGERGGLFTRLVRGLTASPEDAAHFQSFVATVLQERSRVDGLLHGSH